MQAATQQQESTQSPTRLRGFIKGAKVTLGFCFVRVDNGSVYFLHAHDLEGGEKEMVPHSLVEFTPISVNIPGKSDRATKAVIISKPQPKKRHR